MRHRAFSLVEVMVALAIAGVVLAAALTTTVALQGSLRSSRVVGEMTSEAGFALEHLLRPLRVAGADAVRPWQAISTSCQNDPRFTLPPCTADRGRLHVTRIEPGRSLRIVAATSTSVTLAARADGSCPVPLGPVVLFPSEATSTAMQGPAWRARRCTAAASSGCGCTLSDTPKAGFDAAVTTAVTDAQLAGGTLMPARVFTYYVEDGYLMALADVDGSGTAASTPLVPRVERFATRLGYDGDVDGRVDAAVAAVQPAVLDRLRLVRVGLVLGAPAGSSSSSSSSVPFLGGTVTIPGRRLVVVEGNGVVRATGIFQ
jgi:prepilin-type N-terminal cleavage/methylation domain-containing protein